MNNIQELALSELGLIATGNEDTLSPRREYTATQVTRDFLDTFFFMNDHKNTLWLTPAIIEDILIFYAFNTKNFKAVFVKEQDNLRTLYATNDLTSIPEDIKHYKGVLINPALLQPCH